MSSPEAAYAAARDRHLPALRRLFQEYFSRMQFAAIVFPATLVPPPADREETMLSRRRPEPALEAPWRANIAPGSTAGLPGLVASRRTQQQWSPIAVDFDAPAAIRPRLGWLSRLLVSNVRSDRSRRPNSSS